jgi:hypothetical protein
VLLEQRDERLDVEALRLRHDVLDQPVQQARAVLHVHVHVREELAEAVEDLVEVAEDVRARHLGDVVQRLARVITYSTLRIIEAL